MAFSPPKPPRSRKIKSNDATRTFRDSNNITNNNRDANDETNNKRHGPHLSPNEHHESGRSGFIIPPPSRKYTTTNPGTLSPIYHLVYDLTAPTTVTSTTATTFLDTLTTAASHSNHHPSKAVSVSTQSANNPSHLGPSDINKPGLGHGGQVWDGHGFSSHSGLPVSTGNSTGNYLTDKRQHNDKRDRRNGDATNSLDNKTRGVGVAPYSPTSPDSVVKRSEITRPSLLAHLSQPDRIGKEHTKGNPHCPDVSSNVGFGRNVSDPHFRFTHHDQKITDGEVTPNSYPNRDSAFESRISHPIHTGNDSNIGLDENGVNSSANTNGDRLIDERLPVHGVSVKRAIDKWGSHSNESNGQSGVIEQKNSVLPYHQSECGPNAKRAVFKREGDCVRLFLVNNDKNNSPPQPDVKTYKGDNRHADEPDSKFRRGEKTTSSQRWLNKLGLLSIKGSNSKAVGKGNRKKDLRSNNNGQTNGDGPRQQVSKKPVNRWDSIHVHTKQAIASSSSLEAQTGRTKSVSFVEAVTTPISPEQSVAGLTSDVTYRPMPESVNNDHVTDRGKDKVTSKAAIKGILVNRGKSYDANTGLEISVGQRIEQNGVQFHDDTAVNSSPHLLPGKLFSSPTSSSTSSSIMSAPRREVIDKNKYIIKQRTLRDSTHRLNRSHDSVLTDHNDPILRLDNLINVITSQNPEADKSSGPDQSIINDMRSWKEGLSSISRSARPQDSEETATSTSLSTCHLYSEPSRRGSTSKLGTGGSVNTRHPYIPLRGGRSEHFGHRQQIKEIKAGSPPKWFQAENGVYNRNNSSNTDESIHHQNGGTSWDSNGDHRVWGPGNPTSDQTTSLAFTNVRKREDKEEKEVALINHSSVTCQDTVTDTVEGDNNQVDGDDTLRYRRTLREIGKKNQNLFSLDQNSQWIRQRFEDLNSGFTDAEGPLAQRRDSSVLESKPQPNTKPKITPRQKFEITHNRGAGRVATNLRSNQDKLDPSLSMVNASNYRDSIFSKPAPNALDTAIASPLYKESPRAKFERDRAARIQNNNTIHTNTTFTSELSHGLPSCHERLNKSCDDLDTDSDGYLRPSTYHKSRSTETLLSCSDSQTPLAPISKLSPRARFENSRWHSNLKTQIGLSYVPHELLRGDDRTQHELHTDSWTNIISNLESPSLSRPVRDSDLNDNRKQNLKFAGLSSHHDFPHLREQRNGLITTGVRSVQLAGDIKGEWAERPERPEREDEEGRAGAGRYGTSELETFLSKHPTTHLSSTANIDTGASRWSGAGGEEGIRNASDERRVEQLNKSRAECRIRLADVGAPIITQPALDRPTTVVDSQCVQDTGLLGEGNFKISSVNVASLDRPSVISNNFHLPSDSGAPHEGAYSASCTETKNHGYLTVPSQPPRPAQVSAVKKMSPDSVSSSGYESEHTSSAIFHKNSRNNIESANKDSNNNNSYKSWVHSDKSNNDKSNNSLDRKTTNNSTVQQLRLHFGHSQQQQQQQQSLSVDSCNGRRQQNQYCRKHLDGNDCVGCENQNSIGNNQVLFSDDQYDESIVRGKISIPANDQFVLRNKKSQFSSAHVADVNNNNNNNTGPNNQNNTGVRYNYLDNSDKICRDNNVRKIGLDEFGSSDTQVINPGRIHNNVRFERNVCPTAQCYSPRERVSPKDKKQNHKLEKVNRSMHEIIHDLKLDSDEIQTNKRTRRNRRCSQCQDKSSPTFCSSCKNALDCSRDSVDVGGLSPSSNKSKVSFPGEVNVDDGERQWSSDSSKQYIVRRENRVSHSVSDVAAMLASKGLRIYEDTGEYVPMKSPLKSPTLTSLTGYPFNVEAARYLIVPTIVESLSDNDSKSLAINNTNANPFGETDVSRNAPNKQPPRRPQRQAAADMLLAQRSISDSGADAFRPSLALAREDDAANNGAHSDGDICDDSYLSMNLVNARPRAMSMDILCSDGAIPDGDDSTDNETIAPPPPQRPVSRLRRKDRRSSKGYVEWRTCSGWVGKTDMRLAEGRNSRGYIEWDTIWTTATPWKADGADDEHVYDVIHDDSTSQIQRDVLTHTQTTVPEIETPTAMIDTPPALPERTYINRLKNANSPSQQHHNPHNHSHSHVHQHHLHHQHQHPSSPPHTHHHHHHHNARHPHQSHSNSGGRRSHSHHHHHHHHRSSPQTSCSNATPKLKSASKPPPPAPPVPTTHESQADSQNYAVVSKLKGYKFSDPLTSPSGLASHPSTDKSVIYSENYWHLGPVTSEEHLTSWQTGDVLDYIDGLHDSMSPKRRENIYILLNNKKTRAKFSESLEIESRLLSKGLLSSPGSHNDTDSQSEDMDTSSSIELPPRDPVIKTTSKAGGTTLETDRTRCRKVRTSVSSTYV